MFRAHAHRLAIMLGAAVASGTHAAPMIFTNPAPGEPGHFDWAPPPPPIGDDFQLLDITLPSSQQLGPGENPPSQLEEVGSFGIVIQSFFDPFVFPNTVVGASISPGFGGRIHVDANGFGLFQPGDVIGPGGVIPMGAGGSVWTDFLHNGQFVDAILDVPLGEHYLGVSFFELDEQSNIIGDHFGFIGFELFENPDGSHDLFATSWGYETELDTPITIIPAPGAISFLALGACAAHRRRRST